MAAITPVSDLKPFKSMWKIHVKIIRLWKQYSAAGGETIEMVLIDSNGVKINATVKKDLALPIEIEHKEGDWIEILNFEIRRVFQLYRTTKHKYTITFTESSLFRKIEPVNGSKFLCCANFRGINRGLYHPMYCIDLCGALVSVGDLIATKTYQPANLYMPIIYSLEFSLINLGYTQVRCVAHGTLARTLNAFWLSNTADVVVCVLRLWRIEWGAGGLTYVTNLEGISEILFDTDIPEIQFFKSQIPMIDF